MKDQRNLVEAMFNMFARITSIILICAGLYIRIFWGADAEVGTDVLFGIPMIGVLTAVPCALLFYKDNLSKRAFILRSIGLYCYVNVVVFAFGIHFRWIRVETPFMVLGMFLDIFLVFAIVTVCSLFMDQSISNKMNARLGQIQRKNRP